MRPPINRAIACFRATLWLLPSGFAMWSHSTLFWLVRRGYLLHGSSGEWSMGAWLLPNILFVVGAGWYYAMLSPPPPAARHWMAVRAGQFVLSQLLIVPFVGALFAY